MNNLQKLQFELNNVNYGDNWTETLESILEDNGLDPLEEYSKQNDRIEMLESVYDVLQSFANDTAAFLKVQTEFTTVTAAYAYLQKRLADIRADIDRLKEESRIDGGFDEGQSRLTSYMFFNGR